MQIVRFYPGSDSQVKGLSHAPFADLLQNLVMANGRADHRTPPHAMQLCPMLRGEGAKGNGNPMRLGSSAFGVFGQNLLV